MGARRARPQDHRGRDRHPPPAAARLRARRGHGRRGRAAAPAHLRRGGRRPTGVELAGAMVELARHAMPREFRRINPAMARIVLIEAGPRVLPTFPEDLSTVALRSLERMCVQVLTNTRVTRCGPKGVECGDERIGASTIVWAAVVASPAGAWIGAERDRQGRIRVGPDLSVPGHPGVFAVGDIVTATDGNGRPVPGNAPSAKQMGRYVGRLLAARAAGKPAPPPFSYRHHGDLATIGRRSAVVELGRVRLTGLVGWWFWGIAHVYYLVGFRSRVVVSFEWLWSYLTFQRGARLITGREPRGGNAVPIPGQARVPGQGRAAAAEAAQQPAPTIRAV